MHKQVSEQGSIKIESNWNQVKVSQDHSKSNMMSNVTNNSDNSDNNNVSNNIPDDVNNDDIQVIVSQVPGVELNKIIELYKKNNKDVVDTIIELTS